MAEGKLEKNRCGNGSGNHHQNHRSKESIRHQTERRALGGYNQSNLAAGNHAGANLQTLQVCHSAKLCAEAAANDLCQNSNNHQQNGEENNGSRHGGQRHLQTDACKEDRRKQNVRQSIKTRRNVLGALRIGNQNACDIGARNIGHTEEALRTVSKDQTEHKGDNDKSAHILLIPGLELVEQAIENIACSNGENKESNNLQEHHADVDCRIGQTRDNGECNDTEDIVNYGRTQNSVAGTRIELPHFLERFNRDAHGCCGKNDAHKNILQHHHRFACAVRRLVEKVRQRKTTQQRHNHADQSNDKGCLARFLQFANISFKAGGEHQNNNAEFSHLCDKFCFRQHIKHGRTKYKTSHKRADHLGHSEPLGDKSEHLCGQED